MSRLGRVSTIPVAAILLSSGCADYHRSLHKTPDESRSRNFDVYANARCAHLANMFRPDRVREGRVGIPFVGGVSFHRSEEYARVTEPILMTINQVALQACIQLELGEIEPKEYADIIRSTGSRYMTLARLGRAVADADADARERAEAEAAAEARAIAEAANESLGAQGAGVANVDPQEIVVAAAAAEQQILAGGEAGVRQAIVNIGQQTTATGVELAENGSAQSALLQNAIGHTAGSASMLPTTPGPSTASSAVQRLASLHILFDTGSATISAADRERVQKFLAQHCCKSPFSVYGFADTTGHSALNQALSRLRAARVAEILRYHAPNILITEVGLGEGQAFGSLLQDNRVVYVIVSQGPAGSR